ncbi:MAG: hypothetical protein H0X17_11370 [Deltaproteobacteria bacterium]|nr:hypothetical protein [Deltaproteobacteria bacterium]
MTKWVWNKWVWSSVVLSGVLAASGTAAAEPAYCQALSGRVMHTNPSEAVSNTDPRMAIWHIVGNTCNVSPNTETAQRQREIEAVREKWSKRLNMTPADWKDAAEWASVETHMRGSLSMRVDPKKAWSTLTPIEQFAAIDDADANALYITDALGAKLTEVGRLGYILHCFGQRQKLVD